MSKYDGKTNNEVILEIKQLQNDHEALKAKMLKDYDKLIEIEKDFAEANKVITERLKGSNA
jgi:hypothetical protein